MTTATAYLTIHANPSVADDIPPVSLRFDSMETNHNAGLNLQGRHFDTHEEAETYLTGLGFAETSRQTLMTGMTPSYQEVGSVEIWYESETLTEDSRPKGQELLAQIKQAADLRKNPPPPPVEPVFTAEEKANGATTVTLYLIDVFRAYIASTLITPYYSQDPWGGDDANYQGDDDGGKLYKLPKGYWMTVNGGIVSPHHDDRRHRAASGEFPMFCEIDGPDRRSPKPRLYDPYTWETHRLERVNTPKA